MDLNSDLGESFGRWTLGDDAAMLDIVTRANVACGFHAGDPHAAPHLRAGRRGAGWSSAPRSATGTWPGSAAASSTWSPAELADDVRLPDRGAAGDVPGGRHRGALREAARRAVQRDRAPRASRPRRWSRRCATTTRRCRCSACPARPSCAPPRPPACAPCGSSSSTAATPRRATLVPRTATGRCCMIRGEVTERVVRLVDGRGGDRGGRQPGPVGRRVALRARGLARRRRDGRERYRAGLERAGVPVGGVRRRSRPGDRVEGGADDGAAGRRRRAAGRGGRAAGGAGAGRRGARGAAARGAGRRARRAHGAARPGPRHRPRDDPSRGARPAGRTRHRGRSGRCRARSTWSTTARTWTRWPG